jgi:ribokinase
MGEVVVVGSFNVDHVWECEALPQAGQTLAGRYRTGPGGKGFNQAIAARRAGADTRLFCALGDDAGSQLAYSLAEMDGLELVVRESAERTGTAGIYVDARGRNSIVIGAGANATLDPAFIESQRDILAGAAVVLCQLETPPATVAAALRAARAAGAVAMLNPAPANAPADDTLLASVDVLTPNETELTALLAARGEATVEASAVALMASERLHELCRRLLPHGTVVVTLGDAGCFVSHAERALRGDTQAWYRMAAAPAQAVDTTGAGDAFSGALAAALAAARDDAFQAHVRFAVRYAALSVERAGAASAMPLRDEVDGRFGR